MKECFFCGHEAHNKPCTANRHTHLYGEADGPCGCEVKDSDNDELQQMLAIEYGAQLEIVLKKCSESQAKLRATRDTEAIRRCNQGLEMLLEEMFKGGVVQ